MKITMLPVARQEMLRTAEWYDRRTKGAGDRFLDRVRDGLLSIKEFPRAAPSIGAPYRRKILSDFPYGLVFCINGDAVLVVAVAHLKRKPRYWKLRPTSQTKSD